MEIQHVLFLPDGNGRWARQRGLKREEGHLAGVKRLPEIIEECLSQQIHYASFFLFSTENWGRSPAEVEGIFKVLEQLIVESVETWHQQGVRFRHLGHLHRIPLSLRQAIAFATRETRSHQALTVSFAIDYGGRDDLISAMQQMRVADLPSEQITEKQVTSYLSSADLPDPDLLIRTGNRLRISNGFLWELAYTELWFTEVLWPDFGREAFRQALEDVRSRQRTFGKVLGNDTW
jgi:undecaprenyl diphosphate synthase